MDIFQWKLNGITYDNRDKAIANLETAANANKVLAINSTGDGVTVQSATVSEWGSIGGTISNQTDLATILNDKAPLTYSLADVGKILTIDSSNWQVATTNIKTINSNSLLGSGNILVGTVEVGASEPTDTNVSYWVDTTDTTGDIVQVTGTSTTNVMSQNAVTEALATKATPTSIDFNGRETVGTASSGTISTSNGSIQTVASTITTITMPTVEDGRTLTLLITCTGDTITWTGATIYWAGGEKPSTESGVNIFTFVGVGSVWYGCYSGVYAAAS